MITRTPCPTYRRRKISRLRTCPSSRCLAKCWNASNAGINRIVQLNYPIGRLICARSRSVATLGQKSGDGRVRCWIKVAAKLPDDPAIHLGALAYASDWSLPDAAMARHGRMLFDTRILPVTLPMLCPFTGRLAGGEIIVIGVHPE